MDGKRLTKNTIKASLIKQLEEKNANTDYLLDLVNDYCEFWEIKRKLSKDIKERGIVYEDVSSVGVKMQKNNPSVDERVKVNRQMLAILDKLSLTTEKVNIDNEEEKTGL